MAEFAAEPNTAAVADALSVVFQEISTKNRLARKKVLGMLAQVTRVCHDIMDFAEEGEADQIESMKDEFDALVIELDNLLDDTLDSN